MSNHFKNFTFTSTIPKRDIFTCISYYSKPTLFEVYIIWSQFKPNKLINYTLHTKNMNFLYYKREHFETARLEKW